MEGSGLALPDNILEVVNTPGEGKSKWIDENEDLSLTTGQRSHKEIKFVTKRLNNEGEKLVTFNVTYV